MIDSELRKALGAALRLAADVLEFEDLAAVTMPPAPSIAARSPSSTSRAERRQRVMALLADPSTTRFSSREIGRRAGTGCAYVEKTRRELGAVPMTRLFCREGAVREMNVSAIGR